VGGSSSDSDASSVDMQVTTRTAAPDSVAETWRRFRARVEASSVPTVTADRAEGKPGQSFTALSSPSVVSDDGEHTFSWAFTERARAIRFRVTVHGSAVLRATMAGFRQSGKWRP